MFSNKGKEALGGLFLNLCALTYAGVVIDGVLGAGKIEIIIYGCISAIVFCVMGVLFIEKSNERR